MLIGEQKNPLERSKTMKKSNKKGFTIVELVIVIAVVAILAAVLIPTFVSVVNKANVSNDTALVRNLNSALIAEEASGNAPKTMQDVVDIAEDYGYNVSNLQTKADGYKLLWHQETNRFYVQNGDKITTNPEVTSTPPADGYLYWEIADSVSDTHSVYLKNYSGDTVNTTKGVDLGNCTGITAVKYSNTGTQDKVIIRTNSYETNLTVDAVNDTVKHYDMLGNLVIENVKGESYHEYGKVNNVTVKSGRFVAEAGSEISGTVTTEEGAVADTDNATIWGAPTYVWAEGYSACTATRTDSKNEKTETETVEAVLVIKKEATTTEAGSKYYTATFVNPVFGTQNSEDIEIPRILTEEEKALNAVNAELKAYEEKNGKPETMHAAMESLSATSKNSVMNSSEDNIYCYNIETNNMILLDNNYKQKYPEGKLDETNKACYFLFAGNSTEVGNVTSKPKPTSPLFNVYLKDNFEGKELTVRRGVDVGNNSLTNITFSPTYTANHYIRTNGGENLTITKACTVNHYGSVKNVEITTTTTATVKYTEKGLATRYIEINGKNVTVDLSNVNGKAARAIVVKNSAGVVVGNDKTPVCYTTTSKPRGISGVGNGNDIGKVDYNELIKFSDGFGTQNYPFIINDSADWSNLSACGKNATYYFKLGNNFTIETNISTIASSAIVLDLNGHMITLKDDATIQVGANGLTIKDSVGNGGIIKTEVGGTRGLFASFADGANLIIESGNFTGNYLVGKSANTETSITITVNGGTFKVDSFISEEISKATVKIQGGSFNIDPTGFVDGTAYNVVNASNSWTVTKK